MKKFYLFFLGLALSVPAFSQSLTATGQHISGDPFSVFEGTITINNVSGSDKQVLVARQINNLTSGHTSYFCWIQCYSPATNISPDTVTIPAGGFYDQFKGDLEANGISGFSFVTYCFYDAFNTGDSVCVDFVYDATTGLADLDQSKNFISKAYPSPAVEFTNIYYSLSRNTRSAQIKIYNMLGSEVKSVPLTESKGSVRIAVSDMKAGLYFYSLVADGKSSTTGKFTVASH
ncbi:MAG TPA: T9SS type A sorting domain-containing protein [Bacteroidia bacterium]|nr:T9SS type A sorting domain-containing protein [Bacteroidia bacterium]